MRLIVADCAGNGTLWDPDGNAHVLSPDNWTEADVRAKITAGEGGVYVRYRDDGHTVDIAPGETYEIEYNSDNVIDIRSATPAAEEIAAATHGGHADDDRVLRALETAPHDHSRRDWMAQLRFVFISQTGNSLDAELMATMSGYPLEQALHLLND